MDGQIGITALIVGIPVFFYGLYSLYKGKTLRPAFVNIVRLTMAKDTLFAKGKSSKLLSAFYITLGVISLVIAFAFLA